MYSDSTDDPSEHQLIPLAFELGTIRITKKALDKLGRQRALKAICDHINPEAAGEVLRSEASGGSGFRMIASIHAATDGIRFSVSTTVGNHTIVHLDREFWWDEVYMAVEKATPYEGIYYVVRYPTGWALLVKHSEVWEEHDHCDWWEESLAAILAEKWAKHLGLSSATLESQLALLVYGFPRGRISEVKDQFLVLQSRDITQAMGVSKKMIEQAFNIVGHSRWQYDEHERCIVQDKEELRRLLQIQEDWKAV